ncbi:hypothetical protein FACS189462_5240 [Spirochaetia bacterium]|nr:hypothetical protein FACS189462_5240 [Spirochaetia bacterium]
MDLTEGLNTEFKREYTEDAKRAIIAFANTNGGVLYIGINDDSSVAGVPNPDDTLLQISSAVRNAIKPDLTLFVSYERETFKGHTVIKVNVQKGTASPYYLAGKGIRPEGVYVRQGASTAPATETAILKMIKETDGEKFEDVRSLNQELTFEEAAEEFKEKDCEFGPKQMISLKLQNTAGIYTNLGFLLSDQCVHTIKLAIFEGEEKEIFRDRREFSGSLFRQLNETYKFIDMYNRNHGEISGLYRIDRRDYPEEALREALTNALVHRDYAYSSSILVQHFSEYPHRHGLRNPQRRFNIFSADNGFVLDYGHDDSFAFR